MMHKFFVRSVLPALLLSYTGWSRPLPAAGVDPAFAIYPDSETSANPRIACVPPRVGPGGGKCMEVEALFRYALAPWVRFPKGGSLAVRFRDNARREAKELMCLRNGTQRLVVRVGTASTGQLPALVYFKEGKELAAATLKAPLPRRWVAARIQWDARTASLVVDGGEAASLVLPDCFDPQAVVVQTAMIDDLRVEGEGKFLLDWEHGYAAGVQPGTSTTAVEARILGFDAYVISQDETKRDCPMVQVLNGSNASRELVFDFGLRGELSGLSRQWRRTVTVPARASVMLPLGIPGPLASDVYHLEARSSAFAPGYVTARHFMAVENRHEPAGPAKFGLHDSDRHTFGFWPDVLAVSFCHLYASWGYIHGPAWLKDPGITADTPSEQWNWDPRIEQAVQQGLTPYVSIQSRPFYAWMRERDYEASRMIRHDWATLGGFPNLPRYRKFLAALAGKYQGDVRFYEVENEPNSNGISPPDYVEIAKAVSEEIHAVDPQAKVYGICGTGDFVPWMREVFKLGGGKFLDGVSIHTYVTPSMPEEAGLAGKIADMRALLATAGKPLPWLNSETGTYVALREQVDQPVSRERLAELITQGTAPLAVSTGWPSHAVDEWSGSTSIIRNVVTNFLGGADKFIFFGWNDQWPSPDWWGRTGQECFAMVSASKNGERTPSLHTLAIGVLMAQLQGARQMEGKALDEGGILGGVFPKADGGEVAVLWSPLGKRSALIECPGSELEVVSLFGQRQSVTAAGSKGRQLVRMDVGQEPVYLHAKQPGLHLRPSPVLAVAQDPSGGFQFTLVNRSQQDWAGTIALTSQDGWPVTPAAPAFVLKPGKRVKIQAACAIPTGSKGVCTVNAALTLADGTLFAFPIAIPIRPTVVVPRVADGFAWDQLSAWQGIPSFKLNQADQLMIGRPPLLASLQEAQYWQGPAELSGEAKLAASGKELFIYLAVRDANHRRPAVWPGVLGSCVEIFLDRRAAGQGLGSSAYGTGVHQLVLTAPAAPGGSPELWEASARYGKLAPLSVAGANVGAGNYWVALRIPRNPPKEHAPAVETFGFDIGINGPPTKAPGRKNQLMLFGTAANSTDASHFGLGTIVDPP